MSLVPSRQALQQEDTYFRIMNILRQNASVSQRMLAQQVGLSLGGFNYCLKTVVARGWVKVESAPQGKSQRLSYVLTQAGYMAMTDLGQRFLQRKTAELLALRAEIEDLRKDFPDEAVA